MRRMGLLWGAVFGFGLGACSNDAEPTFESAVYDEDAVPAVLSEVQCEAQMGCDCLTVAGPVGEDPEAHTLAQCKEHRRLELEFWQKGAKFHGLTYDATCLARRLEAMDALGCGDATSWSAIQSSGSCADRCRVYHGDLAIGDDCDLTEGVDRCGQGSFCEWTWDPSLGESTGTCRPSCVDDGASCVFATCAPGSQCVESVCEPVPKVGDACPTYSCIGGVCNPETFVCQPFLSPGDDCSENPNLCNYGCVDGICQDGGSPHVCNWDFREPHGSYY